MRSRQTFSTASVGGLVLRSALAGLVAVIVVGAFAASVSRNVVLDIATSDARRVTWAIAIELVQISLVWQLARRLRAGHAQRERLLGHVIGASTAERRRIAGDLDDGVVQELAGVSSSLTAAARTTPEVGPLLDQIADSIRASMTSLRTLLVDIYPPNLYEGGIESALDDLLGQVAKRGIATSLRVDLDERILDQRTAELLYRSAQEALRNVVAHSGASSVSVVLAARDELVTVTVVDDGRGFAHEQWQEQDDDGHVGLRAMADLLGAAGGRIVIRSQGGLGSVLLAALPASVDIPTTRH